MIRFLTLFGVILVANNIYSQSYIYDWSYSVGGLDQDLAQVVRQDEFGNYFLTGGFRQTVDFDPGPGTELHTAIGQDIYVAKFDQLGNFLWVKTMGGSGHEQATELAVDKDNNIILSGRFANTVDFDPGIGVQNLSAGNGYDLFLLKLDNDGNLIWAHDFGVTDYTEVVGTIITDDSSNIYMNGGFGSIVDFEPGPGVTNLDSQGSGDAFIIKLDKNANLVWAKSIGSPTSSGSAVGQSITVDVDQNVITCSKFEGTIDCDPGPDIKNALHLNLGNEGVVVKLDSLGNYQWHVAMKSFEDIVPYDIVVDSVGNTYTTGNYSDTIYLDTGNVDFFTWDKVSPLTGADDAFLIKLDSDGKLIWDKQMGGDSYVSSSWLEISDSKLFWLSNIGGDTDVDPGPDTLMIQMSGLTNSVLTILDSNGDYDEHLQFTCTHIIDMPGLISDINGGFLLWGNHYEEADFDPNVYAITDTSNGNYDIFMIHLDACNGVDDGGTLDSIVFTDTQICSGDSMQIQVFGELNNADFWVLYEDSLLQSVIDSSFIGSFSFQAIDSLVYLDSYGACSDSLPAKISFELLEVTSTLIDTTVCNSFTVPSGNATYFVSGTILDTLSASNGCDSLLTINLTVMGTGAPIMNLFECDSFVSPSGNYIWTSSGIYIDTIPSFSGCDSIITVNLTIESHSSSLLNLFVCDSMISPSGNYVWTISGTYLDTIPNALGCDSIITTNLIVGTGNASILNVNACESFTSPSGNNLWTSSGTYLDTIAGINGCDSIITINLTLESHSTSFIDTLVCDSLISPSGIYVWTSSGNYLDTISNSVGCDSIITTNLSISFESTTVLNSIACDSLLSPSGNFIWTNSGTFADTIANLAGCDSILLVNLTIGTVDPSVTLSGGEMIANQSGATYQWLDCDNGFNQIPNEINQHFVPASNGNYAVEVMNGSCVDTSICHNISNVGFLEPERNFSFNIYPNPTASEFEIILSDQSNVEVRIYSSNSKLIYQRNFTFSEYLSLECPYPIGLYFIEVINEKGESVIKKLIVSG